MSTPLDTAAAKAVAIAYREARADLTGTQDFDAQILHDIAADRLISQRDEPAVDISDAVMQAAYDRLAQS